MEMNAEECAQQEHIGDHQITHAHLAIQLLVILVTDLLGINAQDQHANQDLVYQDHNAEEFVVQEHTGNLLITLANPANPLVLIVLGLVLMIAIHA
jgi:hypothetical protein